MNTHNSLGLIPLCLGGMMLASLATGCGVIHHGVSARHNLRCCTAAGASGDGSVWAAIYAG